MTTESKEFVLYKAKQMVSEVDGKLLYLTIFGSTLYGTSRNGKSDLDVKGIYLPSKEALALQKVQHCLSFSTGDSVTKNTEHDIDIQIWSIQKWLLQLLPEGNTNALDLLFSFTHPKCVLIEDQHMKQIFEHANEFIDIKNIDGCISYAINQAKKYGMKGTKLGTLISIFNWLRNDITYLPTDKLSVFSNQLIEKNLIGCKQINKNDTSFLAIHDKLYHFGISMKEFYTRIESETNKYGERAFQAMQNEGIDWKAISHAIRAIRQIEMLHEKGTIEYPLSCKDELISIKEGNKPWSEVEQIICDGINKIKTISSSTTFKKFNTQLAENYICDVYDDVSSQIPNNEDFVENLIAEELRNIEKKYDVKIIIAAESGSRAWGFESPDSDYDVRFIYMHKKDMYFGIKEVKDVIELPVRCIYGYTLDINGWDIKKALRLLTKGNVTPLEWINSPVIYRRTPAAGFFDIVTVDLFDPVVAWNHYYHLFYTTYLQYEKTCKIKNYTYVVRALTAAWYIQYTREMPPTSAIKLVYDLPYIGDDNKNTILQFYRTKKQYDEKDTWCPSKELERIVRMFITQLTEPVQNSKNNYDQKLDYADRLFKVMLANFQ